MIVTEGDAVPTTETIAEQNTIDIPLYTETEACRYLGIAVSNMLSQFAKQQEQERVSFRSLVRVFILYSPQLHFTDGSRSLTFYPNWIEDSATRDESRLLTDSDWVFGHLGLSDLILNQHERDTILEIIALHQSRVEVKDGTPARLFPFTRDIAQNSPRIVVMDPRIRFGQPTVKGVPTIVLAERWRAGDSATELAEDYSLTTEEVEEALRYESSLPSGTDFGQNSKWDLFMNIRSQERLLSIPLVKLTREYSKK